MEELKKILELLNATDNIDNNSNNNKKNVFSNIIFEPIYNTLLSSLTNRIRNDAGNYEDLNLLFRNKHDISKASRKQYKIIVSFCKEERKDDIKIALKKYNFLHFLKMVNRILDIENDYILKIEKCKKYFCNSNILSVIDNLYKKGDTTFEELKHLTKINNTNIITSPINDLIVIKNEGNSEIYSLSTEGKNLYAFFMMKNIVLDESPSNFNEGKVNEVLEYLINYISTNTEMEKDKLNKPLLKSSSANYNLDRLINLLNRENSYNNYNIFKNNIDDDRKQDDLGGRIWKTIY